MDHDVLHRRAREQGANPVIYWLVRAVLQPFFRIYFRLSRIGREHIPLEGPVIIAANHRSFLDPFVIGMLTPRPVYYVAKKELFAHPVVGWRPQPHHGGCARGRRCSGRPLASERRRSSSAGRAIAL